MRTSEGFGEKNLPTDEILRSIATGEPERLLKAVIEKVEAFPETLDFLYVREELARMLEQDALPALKKAYESYNAHGRSDELEEAQLMTTYVLLKKLTHALELKSREELLAALSIMKAQKDETGREWREKIKNGLENL